MNNGFAQILLILAIGVVVLSLLGISLDKIFQNKMLKENFGFIWSFIWRWVMILRDWLVGVWRDCFHWDVRFIKCV